ncbi:MAG: hypothetical protein R3A79_21775 [Nannocystaceae bacterium]
MFDVIIDDIAASKRGMRGVAAVFLLIVFALIGVAMTSLEGEPQKITLLLAGLVALPGFIFLVNAVTPVAAHPLVKALRADPRAIRSIDATAVLRNNAHVAWRLAYKREDGSKIWTSQLGRESSMRWVAAIRAANPGVDAPDLSADLSRRYDKAARS